eukprot:CAMPEP_0116929272 /NCGR_PEP_ID=MMETSP0467-20121206/26482_1 /TAXON_ID=283647 /ORGANISM="Mesodinium pulex, Strain SPMC105" /LENGTH=83 /DNA_ID=CAMNT_0004609209 /DNA_START=389 /DNA_END=640 /DNA_ORIENTATION=+
MKSSYKLANKFLKNVFDVDKVTDFHSSNQIDNGVRIYDDAQYSNQLNNVIDFKNYEPLSVKENILLKSVEVKTYKVPRTDGKE